MFIRKVDEGFARLLREELPFSSDDGDISFEVPTRTWSDALIRPTVNLYLFDLSRSGEPSRLPTRRVGEDGRNEQRPPAPMIELNYSVSAWAGDPLGSHELLGRVISRIGMLDVFPAEYLEEEFESTVRITFIEDDRHRARDIWNGAGNLMRASFSMHVTVAADSSAWAPGALSVSGITGVTRRTDRRPA